MIRTFKGTINSWYLNLRSIKYLYSLRDELNDRIDISAINFNLIQNAAAAVEGSTKSLIIDHMEGSEYYKDIQKNVKLELKAVLDNSIRSVYKKGWQELIKYSKEVLEINVKEIYNGDWKNIWALFQLRNITAHGGIIIKKIEKIPIGENFDFYSRDEYQLDYDNILELTNYLKSKNYLSISIPKQVEFWEYFGVNVADHFIDVSFEYMIQLYQYYTDEHKRISNIEKNKNIISVYKCR